MLTWYLPGEKTLVPTLELKWIDVNEKSDAPSPPRDLHIAAMCQSDKWQVSHTEYKDAKIPSTFSSMKKKLGKKRSKDIKKKGKILNGGRHPDG